MYSQQDANKDIETYDNRHVCKRVGTLDVGTIMGVSLVEDRCDISTPIVSIRSALGSSLQNELGSAPNGCLGHNIAKLKVSGGLASEMLDKGEPGKDANLDLAPEFDLPMLGVSGSTVIEFEVGGIKQAESKEEDDLDQLVEPHMVDEWYGDLVVQPTPPSGEF